MDQRLWIQPAPMTTKLPGINKAEHRAHPSSSRSFQQVLHQEVDQITFSSHAAQRMSTRGIPWGEKEMRQLTAAVDKAEQKGSRSSLIVMPNLALVVSISNRKVITAIDKAGMQDNIFTNIDSTVIVTE
ncbi:TIGR02530 family flagellar biosynthesis protein [Heliophilum fasciatum]|nr:TIGR02530 family flagellar biosynthesis protein [Heliophilum fasciatum]MCW2277937.1 flagellar operon protein [Heliophilum fasciatum]